MLRHKRVIDVPEGLLLVGLHCRPGAGLAPFFAHTDDDTPLKLRSWTSPFGNRAAHDIPFLEVDCEYRQPSSAHTRLTSLSVPMNWPRFASAHVVGSSG